MKSIEKVGILARMPDGTTRRVVLRETKLIRDILEALSLDDSHKVIHEGKELSLDVRILSLGVGKNMTVTIKHGGSRWGLGLGR